MKSEPSTFNVCSVQPIPWDVEDEWLEWYRMTPADRWEETTRLWTVYLEMGGSMDGLPDSQSPFYVFGEQQLT